MDVQLLSTFIAIAALIFSVAIFVHRLRDFNRLPRPEDRAPTRGSVKSGVLYAYTLGMAPWAKESTRRHWLAYLRGITFHLGIFLGLAILLASPFMGATPLVWRSLLAWGAGAGAFFGLIGFVSRIVERGLKFISTPDDYFSVLLVSIFLSSASLWLLYPTAQPVFYLAAALMLVYAPFSKIRHCIYFAFSRLFYGKFVGRRAILPHSQQQVERA